MNSKYRISVLLVCLMLGICTLGLAEETEIISATVPEAAQGADGEMEDMPEVVDMPAELPVIEAEIQQPDSTQVAAEEDVSPTPAPAPSTALDAMEEISGVASGANYSCGYARLVSPATGYTGASPDARAVIYLESGVLYVSARRESSAGDRLRVHFTDGGETRSVWVDEFCLRPMSAGEVLDFVTARLGESKIRFYGGNPMLPLDEASCSSVITYSNPAQERAAEVPAMFVNQTRISVACGEVLPIGVSFSDGKGHTVYYTSENTSIASVSGDGRVTGVSAGDTCVQIRSEFSNVAVIEIHVHK